MVEGGVCVVEGCMWGYSPCGREECAWWRGARGGTAFEAGTGACGVGVACGKGTKRAQQVAKTSKSVEVLEMLVRVW